MENGVRERFEKHILPEPMSGCWLWNAAHGSHGYGHFGINGKVLSAHRVSFELYRSRIPEGLFVLHRCDVKSCVNPDHLFLGTQIQNLQDMTLKGHRSCARGESSGSAKLKSVDIEKIRKDDRSHRTIAKDYKVGKTTIGSIKSGKAWRSF